MAIFLPGQTRCLLCRKVVRGSDLRVSTSHFISNPRHPLAGYSDSVLHKTCFLKWKHRAWFVREYNAFWVRESGVSRVYMTDDGSYVDE